jgi:hypothetical protein
MTHNQSKSSNNVFYELNEYKTCAGRFCNNAATHCLKIVLVKKSGWFCDSCRQDLEENGLVD